MKDHATDYGGAVIINESALNLLGFKDAELVIDKKLILADQSRTIIGVVKDFHQMSLKQTKTPTIFQYIPWSQDYLTVSLNSGNLRKTMANRECRRHVFPENGFEYFFLDDQFNRQYQGEERIWKLFILSAGLAILIA